MNFFKPNFWDKNRISFFSILLFPISLLIIFLFYIKRYLKKPKQTSIPVICVGNIYLGGTGKTPLSIEIFSILKNLNINSAFIRKKYDSFQDEVDLLKKIGPVYQNKKRLLAIDEANKKNAKVAILDDGFQDFSLKKKLSIICFSEKQWIGNGMTIPSGPLRENLSGLKRANLAVINGKKNSIIEEKIFSKNKDIKIFYTSYIAENIEEFKNKNIIAFAGIGNPENFFNLLKSNGLNITETLKFTDHHKYSQQDLKNLLNKIKESQSILLTTEKDYLRIPEDYKVNIKYLKIKIKMENKNQFIEEIKKII